MTSLKVFLDHASQPSRAVLVFCKINKIPFELVETRITKMEVLFVLLSIDPPNMLKLILLKKSQLFSMAILVCLKVQPL